MAKTQWNNPWLSVLLRFTVCQGLFRWVVGFYHWLTSLSAVCDSCFPLSSLLPWTIFFTHHFFCISYALLALLMHSFLFETEVWKAASLAFWGRLTCTLVSPLLNCPGPFVWCLPLCDYNITQLFAFCKMADSTKYASCTYATCRILC